jgi:hypothetical protein
MFLTGLPVFNRFSFSLTPNSINPIHPRMVDSRSSSAACGNFVFKYTRSILSIYLCINPSSHSQSTPRLWHSFTFQSTPLSSFLSSSLKSSQCNTDTPTIQSGATICPDYLPRAYAFNDHYLNSRCRFPGLPSFPCKVRNVWCFSGTYPVI